MSNIIRIGFWVIGFALGSVEEDMIEEKIIENKMTKVLYEENRLGTRYPILTVVIHLLSMFVPSIVTFLAIGMVGDKVANKIEGK